MNAVRPIMLGVSFLLSVFLGFSAIAFSQNPATPALPKEMADQVSADTGKPIIFQRQWRGRGNLIWGLSTKAAVYGQTVPVLLWFYNPTDEPQPVMTCSDIDWFWIWDIDVFDSSGSRVPSLAEEEAQRDSHKVLMRYCTREFAIYIPPHTCMHGNFSKLEHDFARDLRAYYSLLPGDYYIVPSERDQNDNRLTKTRSNAQDGLRVEVIEP